ncbi:uncharacterized protein LOC133307756 [Gastrolobium bilobum]|uniref:uncharacterized protein LOC133307756 n=1 Tax=Gastrolobium bilobum TaxID=150636 RepID=UPI002AB30CAA|nr:uncharacterized protein LOC133307756 [Gastrolobium bilobum]
MEWRKYYMDLMLVPLGLVIILAYHVWLWHKIRTQPFTTIFGIDAYGQHLWIPAMMKDIEKTNILVVQSLRYLIMGSTLMATKSVLICAGLGAVITSTYSVKNAINDSVFGAHGEYVVALKYATLLATFSLSFLCHTLSIRFLNQMSILICTPQDVKSMVTPEYLTELLERATTLNIVGNRLFYSALSLILWIFGPVLTFLASMAMVLILYNLDFVAGNAKSRVEDAIQNDI